MRPLCPPIGTPDPVESKRGLSALAARLGTTGSSAIATPPLPTRLPTADDDDDADDDADADDDVSDDDRDQEPMATTIRRDSVIREILRLSRDTSTDSIPFHSSLQIPGSLNRGVSLVFASPYSETLLWLKQKYHHVLYLISNLTVKSIVDSKETHVINNMYMQSNNVWYSNSNILNHVPLLL